MVLFKVVWCLTAQTQKKLKQNSYWLSDLGVLKVEFCQKLSWFAYSVEPLTNVSLGKELTESWCTPSSSPLCAQL